MATRKSTTNEPTVRTPDLATLREARLAELASALATEAIGDMRYEPLVIEPLGAGLAREWRMYLYRETADSPITHLGDAEAYCLDLGGHRIEIEIEVGVAYAITRKVTITRGTMVDSATSAAHLLDLAQVLACAEVRQALERWAAEDAAADAAAQAHPQQGHAGGQP